MYQTISIMIWVILTLAAVVLPLIERVRKWMVDQIEDNDNPLRDYLTWLDDGVNTPIEALGMVSGWFFMSLIFCILAVIPAIVWPLIMLMVPMTFLFYKLFKKD